MNPKPSYLTSTTAIGFLLTVGGFIAYCFWTKNTDGMVKLVEMIVPSYLMTKGMAMGQAKGNSNGKLDVPPAPSATPPS